MRDDSLPEPAPEKSTLALKLELLDHLLGDSVITEIVINKPGIVITEGRGGWWETHHIPEVTFNWCMDVAHALQNYSSQKITEASPLLGAQLPDGQRVQIVIPPAVPAGTVSITIRRPGTNVLTLHDLAASGAFESTRCVQSALLTGEERGRLEAELPERDKQLLAVFRAKNWPEFWRASVLGKKNIVSSGATGAGKTTLSIALAMMIPLHERLITIEDVREMRLPHANLVNLIYSKDGQGVSKLTPRQLLEAVLRMRPDRVLLAELRGDETFFFIQNVLNSGHPGTITTVHATCAKMAFKRLALLIKGSAEGAGIDLADIMETMYALIDVVAQMERLDSGQRVVSEVYFDPAFAAKQLG
jgi:type IV secretion system protein VirB11